MNLYSELLDLLCPRQTPPLEVLFGTVSGVAPLRITVGDREIRQGLMTPRGTAFTEEDLGQEVALLPLATGFLLLFPVEGGTV